MAHLCPVLQNVRSMPHPLRCRDVVAVDAWFLARSHVRENKWKLTFHRSIIVNSCRLTDFQRNSFISIRVPRNTPKRRLPIIKSIHFKKRKIDVSQNHCIPINKKKNVDIIRGQSHYFHFSTGIT